MGNRTIGSVLVVGLSLGVAWPAAPPPVPSYQRVLRGEEAREAARLQEEAKRLEAEGRYKEAAGPARRLEALRARVQGAGHWEAVDARWEVKRLLAVAGLPAEQRAEYGGLKRDSAAARTLVTQGHYRKAELLLETVLATRRKALGEDHPDTASSYNNLAFCLNAQSKYAQAQALYVRAMANYRKTLGEEHPDTARGYNNLACNLLELGKYAEARPLFEKALAIFRATLGEEHSETARNINNLAVNLDLQGKYAQAQPLLEKALAIRREALGERHPDTAAGYNNLASNLNAQGKYSEARPLLEKALAIRRKALGEEHPDTAAGYNNLAMHLKAQGKYAQARPLLEKALAVWRKTLGEEHPYTATGYDNLAGNLDEQSRFAEARPLYEKALAIRRKALGEAHFYTGVSYNGVAMNLDAQGKHRQARPPYEKALAVYRQVLGDNHPVTARVLNNLAMNLNDQGRYEDARPLFEKALASKRAALGDDHPDTATGFHNLAANLNRLGKYVEARSLLEKAVAVRRQALGEGHPDTSQSYSHLAKTLHALGEGKAAREMAVRACRAFQAARLHVGFTGMERSAFSARDSPHLFLALLYAGSGEADAAWQALEQHLARGLLDEVAGQQRALSPAQRQKFSALSRRWQLLERQLLALAGRADAESLRQRDDLRDRLDRTGRDLGEWQAQLAKIHGPTAGAVYDRRRVQESLPDDGALVGWLDLGGESWACLLRRRGPPVWARLPAASKQDVEDLALELTRAPAEAEPAWLGPARRLYKQRLAPLARHLRAAGGLPAARRLIVLPSPALAGVPVEALLAAGKADFVVSYAPSGTLFAHVQRPRTPGRVATGLLALGDPLFARPAGAAAERGAEPPPVGVYLAWVAAGGKAGRAGLRGGDVLLAYGGAKVHTSADLLAALRSHAGDDSDVEVRLWREGRMLRLAVKPGPLGARPAGQSAALAVRAAREADALLARAARKFHKPLPGTRSEVEAIAGLFPGADMLTGAKASEESLDALARQGKLKGYRFVHLATHGHASERHPLASYLALSDRDLPDPLPRVLAGKPAYTGSLTAGQILQGWELDAEVVVLSACQSGLGRYEGGEGYVGFAQPLFAVGARSVVLSLWSVSDEATALLMVRFYQNLLGKRPGLRCALGKAEALAEAKGWLRGLSAEGADQALAGLPGKPRRKVGGEGRPYEAPYYWAAFILAGDPHTIGRRQGKKRELEFR